MPRSDLHAVVSRDGWRGELVAVRRAGIPIRRHPADVGAPDIGDELKRTGQIRRVVSVGTCSEEDVRAAVLRAGHSRPGLTANAAALIDCVSRGVLPGGTPSVVTVEGAAGCNSRRVDAVHGVLRRGAGTGGTEVAGGITGDRAALTEGDLGLGRGEADVNERSLFSVRVSGSQRRGVRRLRGIDRGDREALRGSDRCQFARDVQIAVDGDDRAGGEGQAGAGTRALGVSVTEVQRRAAADGQRARVAAVADGEILRALDDCGAGADGQALDRAVVAERCGAVRGEIDREELTKAGEGHRVGPLQRQLRAGGHTDVVSDRGDAVFQSRGGRLTDVQGDRAALVAIQLNIGVGRGIGGAADVDRGRTARIRVSVEDQLRVGVGQVVGNVAELFLNGQLAGFVATKIIGTAGAKIGFAAAPATVDDSDANNDKGNFRASANSTTLMTTADFTSSVLEKIFACTNYTGLTAAGVNTVGWLLDAATVAATF